MLINNKGEAVQAQLPYILTSILCVALDVLVSMAYPFTVKITPKLTMLPLAHSGSA